MRTLLKILTYLSAVLGALLFLRPTDSAVKTLLWIPKLIAGALSPILGFFGGMGVMMGLKQRDWKLAGAGILSAGLVAKFIADIPSSEDQFEAVFGPDWQAQVPNSTQPSLPPRRISLPSRSSGKPEFKQNVVIGQNHMSGKTLLADLWQPHASIPRSGLGLIYAHGSGWRVGDKDLGTRAFFRRLAGQGHVVLDIAYTLWPQADIPRMVSEINQATLWMKEMGATHGVNPERIILIGGSAGGHLALMAAYTPNHPAFLPTPESGDTSVHGVVAFYPPVDLLATNALTKQKMGGKVTPIDQAALALINWVFMLHPKGDQDNKTDLPDYMSELLGGDPDQVPEMYQLLSPIHHISSHCPPTLLLQGNDDVFELAPPVHRFHQELQAAGVPTILVELPHTDHGFDLLLPQISPTAQAATYDVERFLALLV